jgi:hypothetical protein
VGRNEAEEVVAAVVVTATMPGCRLAQGGSAAGFLGLGVHVRTNIVRRMCHISDKLRSRSRPGNGEQGGK